MVDRGCKEGREIETEREGGCSEGVRKKEVRKK